MAIEQEKPIRIYIYRFGSDKYAPSHAALEYNDKTIDYGSKGFNDNKNKDQHGCLVYEIYPSKIGVNPKRLEQAINQLQKKRTGSDYQYFTQNCADQVLEVLKQAGAKNLPNESGLGISIPSLDNVAPEFAQKALNIKTIESYCKERGQLIEERKSYEEFHNIKNKFSTYTQILQDPIAFKKEMTRRCNLELQGKDPDEDMDCASKMLKEYKQTLSPQEYAQFKQKYAAMLKKETEEPSAEEKAKIKAKYNALIAEANLPPEKIKQRAMSSFVECGNDKLLQNTLFEIAQERVPQLVTEYKIKAAKAIQNFPLLQSNRPMDTNIKTINKQKHTRT